MIKTTQEDSGKFLPVFCRPPTKNQPSEQMTNAAGTARDKHKTRGFQE
jgi:hypothetical protein